MSTSFPSATPREIRSYMSDMLSELADLAKVVHDSRLERVIRLLALDVLATEPPSGPGEASDI